MREQGFYRSHRSCNKRWYRLEQYEIQIFSFNMEEGKHRNYWDLTRAERLEHRAKCPQLPSGDGIDKELFSSLTRLLRHFEKDASSEVTHHEPCVEKEMVPTADQLEVGSGNRFVQILPPNFPKPLHPLPDNFNKRIPNHWQKCQCPLHFRSSLSHHSLCKTDSFVSFRNAASSDLPKEMHFIHLRVPADDAQI